MSREVRKPHWPSYARTLKREAKNLEPASQEVFQPLIRRAEAIDEPYYAAMALSWIGARMADAGLESTSVFSSAFERSMSTEPEWRRAEILLHIASEMSKTGSGDLQKLFDAAAGLSDPELRVKTFKTIKSRMTRKGIDISGLKTLVPENSEVKIESPKKNPKPRGCKSNVTLGLYNTYEGKTVKDSHIRAVARAAPLCIAYNLRLALFNFPAHSLQSFIEKVESQTRLKETKKQITRLYNSGCISLEKQPIRQSHPDLGLFVATTSQPQPEKTIGLEELLALDSPLCFLMGLGSSGLPGTVLNHVQHHLELTGRKVPLETCTAMGVLASSIDSARKHQG